MATKKTATNETAIQTAERILVELQAKQDKTVKAREADDRELGAVSYSALAAGDKDAAAKLESVKERALRRDLEIKAIRSAIAQAQNNLAEAKDDAAKAEERRVAGELQELAEMMREAGKKCDRGLAMMIEGSNDLRKIVQATNQRGLGNPSAQQLQSLGSRAVLGALVNSPFAKSFEHLAPRERQSFLAVTEAWAGMVEKFTSHKLGGGEENAA